MAEFFFYSSIVLLVYTFFGYPILLYFFSSLMVRKVQRDFVFPKVTIIIPVHNEEKSIGAKLENCLGFDYPDNKLNIIVVSDGSTDNTEQIVNDFNLEKIRFLPLPFRGGKVMAQNYALQFCDAEIIVFTDVAILSDSDAVKNIVQNFADQTIGAVSCTDAIVGDKNASKGEKSYIRYDMLVRRFTSRIGSLIGVTGGFYAVRSEIAQGGWNPSYPPDFYVAIRCLKKKMRVIEDPRVKAYYKTAAKDWDELHRKVRTINRGMRALLSKPNRVLLNPAKFGVISLQLISHKILRWLMPFFLFSIFLSNGLLVDRHPIFMIIFVPQVILYLAAVLSILIQIDKSPVLKIIQYFFIANIAIVKAWFEFCIGKKYLMWKPTKR